eukprot:4853833-Pyramimonas_sp.AAC.1
MKPSYHCREDSILPPVVYGGHMPVSSPRMRQDCDYPRGQSKEGSEPILGSGANRRRGASLFS